MHSSLIRLLKRNTTHSIRQFSSYPQFFNSAKDNSFNTIAPFSKNMYRHQASLPKLPVPDLKETLSTYLTSVKALVSDQEFERTKAIVADFIKPGGMGEVLHSRLLERDASVSTSWLIDWWNDYAYMSYRDPVVVYVSYFFVLKDDKFRQLPAARAASIIQAAMQFREVWMRQELEPDMARNTPLCMAQYKYMFNSTRIPHIPSDITRLADPATNNHILVMRKNQFFILDLVTKEGQPLSTEEIQTQLEKIYQVADRFGADSATAVGSLTSENRDVWTRSRNELLGLSERNRVNLDKIETAAFAICLDDTKPVTKEESALACWHGDGKNRFFDKHLEFIVFDNAKAGFIGEHSMMDATPTDRLCNYVGEMIDKNQVNHRQHTGSVLSAPERLEFDLNETLRQSIKIAQSRFRELTEKHDLKVVDFEAFGKDYIKKLKVSPDAFAQMAIQLAFYKMYGYCVGTYESAQTKKFAYGRTETCRSCSVESVAWVKAMQDPYVDLKTKGELGRKAIAAQTGYMAKAVEGRGCDRHLLGLKLLLKPDETVPALYTDPSFAKSGTWRLSTSQITSEYYDGYGWGEVVPDGYGVAYMVKNDSLQFNIVSLKLRNHHLKHYFHEALHEMRKAFEATLPETLDMKAKL